MLKDLRVIMMFNVSSPKIWRGTKQRAVVVSVQVDEFMKFRQAASTGTMQGEAGLPGHPNWGPRNPRVPRVVCVCVCVALFY